MLAALAAARHAWIGRLRGHGQFKYGANCRLLGAVRIRAFGTLILGDDVTITGGLRYNPLGGNCGSSVVAYHGACIRIGNDSKMSNCVLVAMSSVEIGNNVLLGSGVRIFDSDFHALDPSLRLGGSNTGAISSPVVIGDHVFIGAYTLVLKGTKIGANAIVGAGSVVTRDIPANEIWGGNPAHFIRNL